MKEENFMADIEKQKFVCIDCETTGLDAQEDRIIEVAVMCFDASQVYAEWESLINPEVVIPETSIAIHHITPEMVKDKPKISEVLSEVLKLIGDHIIVGHGVAFDIEILAAAAQRHHIPTTIRKNRFLDTLRMARLYGESPINSLEQLRKHFNIPLEGAHRAMSDVIVNKEVFKCLAKQYKTTEQLFEVLSRPILLKTMPLGKHKGRPMKEIPLQYLQWIVHKDFDQDLLYSIRTELSRRKKGNLFSQSSNPFSNL
jgi:DNA polymerase-3 subunit epsilon